MCLRLDSCSSLLPLISISCVLQDFSQAFNMFLYAVTLENQDLLYDPSLPQNLPLANIIFQLHKILLTDKNPLGKHWCIMTTLHQLDIQSSQMIHGWTKCSELGQNLGLLYSYLERTCVLQTLGPRPGQPGIEQGNNEKMETTLQGKEKRLSPENVPSSSSPFCSAKHYHRSTLRKMLLCVTEGCQKAARNTWSCPGGTLDYHWKSTHLRLKC